MKILLVDPEMETRKSLSKSLGKSEKKFDLYYANDGVEALSLIQEGTDFEIIISDTKMKRMDGLTLLKTLRKNKRAVQFFIFSKEEVNQYQDHIKNLQLSGWFLKGENLNLNKKVKKLLV